MKCESLYLNDTQIYIYYPAHIHNINNFLTAYFSLLNLQTIPLQTKLDKLTQKIDDMIIIIIEQTKTYIYSKGTYQLTYNNQGNFVTVVEKFCTLRITRIEFYIEIMNEIVVSDILFYMPSEKYEVFIYLKIKLDNEITEMLNGMIVICDGQYINRTNEYSFLKFKDLFQAIRFGLGMRNYLVELENDFYIGLTMEIEYPFNPGNIYMQSGRALNQASRVANLPVKNKFLVAEDIIRKYEHTFAKLGWKGNFVGEFKLKGYENAFQIYELYD